MLISYFKVINLYNNLIFNQETDSMIIFLNYISIPELNFYLSWKIGFNKFNCSSVNLINI